MVDPTFAFTFRTVRSTKNVLEIQVARKDNVESLRLFRSEHRLRVRVFVHKTHGARLVLRAALQHIELQQIARAELVLQMLLSSNHLQPSLRYNRNLITQCVGFDHHVSCNNRATILSRK